MICRGYRLVAAAFLLFSCAIAGIGQTQPNPMAWAIVNGQVLTADQVKAFSADELKTLELRRLLAEKTFERDKQEVYERSLETLIAKTLIEAEAKKRGLTAEALVVVEVDSKVAQPTDTEINDYYEAHKAQIDIPRDSALPQIRTFLWQERRAVLHDAFVEKLRKAGNVQSLLVTPRIHVDASGSPAKGPVDARVTIVEFADFECPFCIASFPTMQQIEKDYGGRIRVVYRQFPLASHPHAQIAALASLCAFEQHKFWEMHDALFQDSSHIDVAGLKQKASALHLAMPAFDGCLDSFKYVDTVNKDLQAGVDAGVNGTPTFFINGRVLMGNAPYEAIRKIVDEELQKPPNQN